MKQLIECVPNFSEGRRPEIIEAIADAIRGVPGAHVLDVSADADHNRCVVTFVGNPKAVEEGAFRAIAKAAQLIDLDKHEGEHPRIGATDVCPFIPVKGVNIEDCVTLAKNLGQRVGEELGIAVYLYGSAASRPERQKLADIRRGQYEAWRQEVSQDPSRLPDYGPSVPRSWGATVIGVRPFLIAYNLYLNSDDIDVANRIARAVRFSSGGLRNVQALGFLVEGQAQVSMYLTNFEKTPVHRVQELVRREAARFGLVITKAELVGLIPQKALLSSAKYYLQLNDMADEQVLEIKLAQSEESEITPFALLDATAAGTPTPGGGSSAALVGALGTALTEMVANLTIGRKKYAQVEKEAQQILIQAQPLREQLTVAIVEDSAAFDQLMAVWRNAELSGEEKQKAIELATIHAAEIPMKVARLSLQVANLAKIIASTGNASAVTDAAAASVLARSAVQIAGLNVKINAASIHDESLTYSWLRELAEIEEETSALTEETLLTAAQRGGF